MIVLYMTILGLHRPPRIFLSRQRARALSPVLQRHFDHGTISDYSGLDAMLDNLVQQLDGLVQAVVVNKAIDKVVKMTASRRNPSLSLLARREKPTSTLPKWQ